ncbi:MAG: ATP-binding protein [Candidatus Microthrix parvicella]
MSASRAVPPLGEWPLIGRAIELEAFERALSRPTCAAVVLYGEAGVGKSRLADTFLASADEMGHPTARVLASAAAATMPLGAMAPVLPADVDASSAPGALFESARRAMATLGTSRPVILVDDAHNLDVSSAVLLTQLIAAGVVMVVATIRDGEPLPDAVAGWWRTPDAVRIDVGDLSKTATREVLVTIEE